MRLTLPCLLACTGVVLAGGTTQPREVQIRSIDFDAGVLELHNFGPTDVDLTGWRFCSHDFNEARRYTAPTGLSGVTVEAGTSIYVHFDNDAPGGDPDRIDRTTLGGFFALPLDQDAYGIQIFFPDGGGNVSFGNSALIADHMQWNIDGQSPGSSEFRTAQATSQGLWTANGDFISTQADSLTITLTDDTGGTAHGPTDYEVENPAGGNDCFYDVNGTGSVDIVDFTMFATAFDTVAEDPDYDPALDFNNTGSIDIVDFTQFATEFGRDDC